MEQVNVVSLHGPKSGLVSDCDDPSDALKEVDRKAWRMHSRHGASWLFRVGLFSSLIIAAVSFVEHPLGAVLSVVCGYLLCRSLIYSIKGHRKIAKYRKAKRYWLLAETQPGGIGAADIMAAELVAEVGTETNTRKAG